MNDPRRWSEGGDSTAAERELLRAAQERRLPESERRALWASIALALPSAPPDLSAATSPARGALAAQLAKGALVASMAAGLGWGATLVLRSAPPPDAPRAAASSSTTATPPAAVPAPSAAAPATPPATTAPSAARAPTAPRPSVTSHLLEESAAVREARAALRAGDPRRCLAILEQARARFPRGALGQEREALTIEALARGGQRAAAQRRAAAFLRAHPQSPYVADLRRIAEP